MGVVRQPARIPVPCPDCGGTAAVVSSQQVGKAALFTPWRGWALATIVEHAARAVQLRCPGCEAARPDKPGAPDPAPTLGL
jgi:hypothetical protein